MLQSRNRAATMGVLGTCSNYMPVEVSCLAIHGGESNNLFSLHKSGLMILGWIVFAVCLIWWTNSFDQTIL